MMSLEAIQQMSEQAAADAARENKMPYVPYNLNDIRNMPGGESWDGERGYPFPALGTCEPSGWEATGKSWFVDTTGMGADWEPALTWRQFNDALIEYFTDNPRHGLGITGIGQFQVFVSAFRKI